VSLPLRSQLFEFCKGLVVLLLGIRMAYTDAGDRDGSLEQRIADAEHGTIFMRLRFRLAIA
jgi:hypothetical protein